jgi:4-amino-4-deoxy-L-arabinose transferase-like glycosyltransferase
VSDDTFLARRARLLLAAIVLVAAVFRLYAPGTSPPGMHPDAASNAWNARCLLAAGTDWSGTPWPIVTSKGFGQGQSTLYYYLLMPFQAVGGMSAATTVLPSAVTGTLSICCSTSRPPGCSAGSPG